MAEELHNRSSALSPEQLAMQNAAISAAVREAVSGVFAQLAPLLKDMAITPEKLREANKPYVDPKDIARKLREGLKTKAEEKALREATERARAACQHLDANGRSTIQLIHNYPDRQPRGLCAHCHDLVEPKHWTIEAPTDAEPQGKAVLVGPHKDYLTVMRLSSISGLAQ
jgi:hypothetical protein